MPSLGDYQANVATGLWVPEANSGINGVAVDTNGTALTLSNNLSFPQGFQSFTAVLRTTGTFAAGKFTVEGSLDNTNWFEMQIANTTSGAAIAAGGFAFTTAATTMFNNVVDTPLRFVRGRLTNSTAGGTAVFVSLFLGAL